MTHSPPTIALLTIGQSPRSDLSAAIESRLPQGATVLHAGVLDGLSEAEISGRFGARGDDEQLITRLADGSVATLGATAVGAGLQAAIDDAEAAGADVVIILCTGEFPDIRASSSRLVEPDVVVPSTVIGLLHREQVGIIVPMPDQAPASARKWRGLRDPLFAAASPYAEDETDLIAAGRRLVDEGARAVILDCMGYDPRHQEALRRSGLRVPVITSGGVVAAALSAIL